MNFLKTFCAASLALLFTSAGSSVWAGETFDKVRARGHLICGVQNNHLGFAAIDRSGVIRGFDADFCRAVAVAMFGDARKVEFVALDASARFEALASGRIDVLIRTTTWTLERDASRKFDFAGINLYDGQGFMGRDQGVSNVADLKDAKVCVGRDTTTERNLADFIRTQAPGMVPVAFDSWPAQYSAFLAGLCDILTDDRSGLVSVRANYDGSNEFVIYSNIISREPLGPMVREDDNEWFDVVKWVLQVTLLAEAKSVTSQNVDGVLASTKDPETRRLLGVEGDLGGMLGLDRKWAYNIISQVGHYGEIFDRNLAPLGMDRGLNRLWTDGGLMYPLSFQ